MNCLFVRTGIGREERGRLIGFNVVKKTDNGVNRENLTYPAPEEKRPRRSETIWRKR